jgi:hypothetical protein
MNTKNSGLEAHRQRSGASGLIEEIKTGFLAAHSAGGIVRRITEVLS